MKKMYEMRQKLVQLKFNGLNLLTYAMPQNDTINYWRKNLKKKHTHIMCERTVCKLCVSAAKLY